VCINDEGEENFPSIMSSYLKSCTCGAEDKISYLQEFAVKLEKELEILEV